jgi:hypothetical protein
MLTVHGSGSQIGAAVVLEEGEDCCEVRAQDIGAHCSQGQATETHAGS